ncbi:hypothetical protein [Acidianus sp. HS-5]|uniref:hypothetical protein n=1 Tax=Acidianus sp. HS-5 TaxID=2886040 RepID=UPI001F201ECD|nr:hypothetical protein [Acidianus sp. HS-5]BDC17795.1 hypothetical protein HS5_06850 [Acidianus sp. HS-5]
MIINSGYNLPPTGPTKSNIPLIAGVIFALLISTMGGYFYYKGVPTNTTTQTSTTSPYISLECECYAISFNGINQYFIAPSLYININGHNIQVGLFNYVAMKYHKETIVIRAYLTPHTQGVLLGLSKDALPSNTPSSGWMPLIYMSDGKLIIAEENNLSVPYEFLASSLGSSLYPRFCEPRAAVYVNIRSPGFYWIIIEESIVDHNTTVVSGFINMNGELIASFYAPAPNASSLFDDNGPYKYNLIGNSFTKSWPLTNGNWYSFNGFISTIIVYPYLFSSSQRINLLCKNEIPKGYFTLFIASSKWYNNETGIWQAYNNPQLKLVGKGDPVLCRVIPTHTSTTNSSTRINNTNPEQDFISLDVVVNIVIGIVTLILIKRK